VGWLVKYDDKEVKVNTWRATLNSDKDLVFVTLLGKTEKAAQNVAAKGGFECHTFKILAIPKYGRLILNDRKASDLTKKRSFDKVLDRLKAFRNKAGVGVELKHTFPHYAGGDISTQKQQQQSNTKDAETTAMIKGKKSNTQGR
jgi:hypothetical protein